MNRPRIGLDPVFPTASEAKAIARKQKPDRAAIRREFREKSGLSRVDEALKQKRLGPAGS